jgi:hypothetical protein
MSPNLEDIGAQAPSNEHVECLSAVLLTYNFYEKELGEFFVIATYWMKPEMTVLTPKVTKATCRECRTYVHRFISSWAAMRR